MTEVVYDLESVAYWSQYVGQVLETSPERRISVTVHLIQDFGDSAFNSKTAQTVVLRR